MAVTVSDVRFDLVFEPVCGSGTYARFAPHDLSSERAGPIRRGR